MRILHALLATIAVGAIAGCGGIGEVTETDSDSQISVRGEGAPDPNDIGTKVEAVCGDTQLNFNAGACRSQGWLKEAATDWCFAHGFHHGFQLTGWTRGSCASGSAVAVQGICHC
jgi:hypothetical protein